MREVKQSGEIPGSGDTGRLQPGHCKKLCIETGGGNLSLSSAVSEVQQRIL